MQKPYYILLLILALIGNTAQAEGYGFRDLRVGSPVSAFQRHCEEDVLFNGMILKGRYTCYGLEDLEFRLIRPAADTASLDPEQEVQWFEVRILEPFMLTIGGEDRSEALAQETRLDWAEAKVAALIENLKKKYQLTWSWDDPKFPERRARILKEFKSKKNGVTNSLDTVFDDGRVSVALEESLFSPKVVVTYRNKEHAARFLKFELSTNKYTAPPNSTELSEF